MGDNPTDGGATGPDTTNQAFCRGRAIPSELNKTIPGVQKVLEKRAEFDTWQFSVICNLKALRLQQMIDKSIARPAANSEYFERWEDMSLQVSSWLTGQVSLDIQAKIQASSKDYDYADDLFELIKGLVLGSGSLRLKAAALRPIRMTRAQYSNAGSYIKEFLEATITANNLNCSAGAYISALLLIHELREDLSNWAYNRQEQLTGDPAKFDWDDFKELCESATCTYEAATVDITAAAHRARQQQQSQPRSQNQSNNSGSNNNTTNNSSPFWDRNKKSRDGPAPGQKEAEFRKLVLLGPNMWGDRCSHCGVLKHGCTNCYYLHTEYRPADWKPLITIWCFKWDKTKGYAERKTGTNRPNNANNMEDKGNAALELDGGEVVQFAAIQVHDDAQNTSEKPIQAGAIGTTPFWMVDSGSSKNIVADRNAFTELHLYGPNETPYRHQTAGKEIVAVKGYGKAILQLPAVNGRSNRFEITAYFNPDLDFNMLSTNQMRQSISAYWFHKDLTIRDWESDEVIGNTYIYCGVPRIEMTETTDYIAAAAEEKDTEEETSKKTSKKALTHEEIMIAHRRLGHIGLPRLQKELGVNLKDFVCYVCRDNKAKRQVSREPQNIFSLDEKDPSGLWYADVQTVNPRGVGGEKMYIVAVNAATRVTVVILLKEKKHTSAKMIALAKQIKLQTGDYPREWLLDGGKEFNQFKTWAEEEGMTFKITPPRTSEPNGPSERYGGHVNELARCVLNDSGLPRKMWPYAVELVVQIINRLHRPQDPDPRPPLQKWREHWKIKDPHANLKHYKVFGCKAWVHIPKEDRVKSEKMKPRAHQGYYVGTEGDHGHVWRVWVPEKNRLFRSRDVTFDETRRYADDYDRDGIPIAELEDTTVAAAQQGRSEVLAIRPQPPVEQPEHQDEQDDEAEGGADEAQDEGEPQPATPDNQGQNFNFQSFTPQSPSPLIRGEPSRRGIPSQRGGRSRRGAYMASMGLSTGWQPSRREEEELETLRERARQRTRDIFNDEAGIRTTNQLGASNQLLAQGHVLAQDQEMDIDNDLGAPEELHLLSNPASTAPVIPKKRDISSRFIEPVGPEKARRLDEGRSAEATGKQIRTSGRTTKGNPPGWLGHEQALAALDVVEPSEKLHATDVTIPITYVQAMRSSFADRWRAAMQRQVDSITEMKTYEEVPHPRGAFVLPGKWVYALKLDKANYVEKFKARWVICGNRQRPGIDFDDTSSPVPTDIAIRMFLTMVAVKKKRCRQIDIVTAYLHAIIAQRKIYMKAPTGFANGDVDWLLLKALYGLRQAAHLWWKELCRVLKKLGFIQLDEDPCIFRRGTTYIIVYVDDLLVADDTEEGIDKVIAEINQDLKVKEIGEPSRFLGCALTRENDTIIMSQKAYADDLLAENMMSSCNGSVSPMCAGYRQQRVNLAKNLDDKEKSHAEAMEALNGTYATIMGQLNWLVVKTRPDLAYAVFRLQRYTRAPLEYDTKAVKRLLRYLRSHDLSLQLGLKPEVEEEIYVDAAFQDHEDGKSTGAYIIYYAGAPVAWSAKKQTLTADSSTIAEIIAFPSAVKEGLYVRKLAVALELRHAGEPLRINTDSDNGVKLIRKPGFTGHPTTRWLENKYFFAHNMLQEGKITFNHVDGKTNPADGLTKPLDGVDYEGFMKRLNMKQDHGHGGTHGGNQEEENKK